MRGLPLRYGSGHRLHYILRTDHPLGGIHAVGLHIDLRPTRRPAGLIAIGNRQQHIGVAPLYRRHSLAVRTAYRNHIKLLRGADIGNDTPRQQASVIVDDSHLHMFHIEIGHQREYEHDHDRHGYDYLGNNRITPHQRDLFAEQCCQYPDFHNGHLLELYFLTASASNTTVIDRSITISCAT